ncbi:MAG: crossover junction endodeoxyribonuclease RuvC [Micrococcales bacterium]
MPQRILGIDPGLTRCGVGIIEVDSRRSLKYVYVDTFRTDANLALDERIGSIAEGLALTIDKYKPNLIALERVFAQHNLKTVMGVAQISGVALLLANQRGLPIQLHTPSEVKAAVTGSGRANKEQVGFMVAKLLGLAEIPKPADAADALAIAITAGWRPAAGSTGGPLTKAQEAWSKAEAASKKSRRA